VPGEIYIGGAGVARGYLNREELMREKFVVIEGERYYRSGDLGRYLPDGHIEFLGRIDNQVKVRGFRVELGEVEATLAAHPAIHEAVVLAHADPTSGKRLVAYIVPEPRLAMASASAAENEDDASGKPRGPQLSPSVGELPVYDELFKDDQIPVAREMGGHIGLEELKLYLQQRLPAYMVPTAFVLMEEMPLTPNGKVNRRALPTPEQARMVRHHEYVPPVTAVEESLAGIYAQVLELERVSRTDNFFEIGGHSLMATQVLSRIREVFQVELPLRSIFETPSVAGLGEAIEAAVRDKTQQSISQTPSITPLNRNAYRI
jgi:acyl carrier protein